MKQTLLLLALGLTTGAAMAQSDKEMDAWKTYMTPTEAHKMMAKSDGDWAEEIKMWMDPTRDPMENKAKCHNEMIMGGRYQQSKSTGEFMGMPFEGMSLLAYDNARKVYQSSWVDNMGTGIMNMEGTMDEKTRTIHFTGTCTDAMTGKLMSCREDFTIVDENTHKMTMWMTTPGKKEMKSMEIVFRRG